MEWFTTSTLAMGSAWTSGLNLYATVSTLGLIQRVGGVKLPGGLEVLDNWWIIGVALGLYLIEFFADKVPYLDNIWDVIHTFIRVPAGAIVAYAATFDLPPAVYIPAFLIGGGLAFSSHGTKAAIRMGANLSPEPISNWILSVVEDVIAFAATLLAVFAPIAVAILLLIFVVFFVWFSPKAVRAIWNIFSAASAFLRGKFFAAAGRKPG